MIAALRHSLEQPPAVAELPPQADLRAVVAVDGHRLDRPEKIEPDRILFVGIRFCRQPGQKRCLIRRVRAREVHAEEHLTAPVDPGKAAQECLAIPGLRDNEAAEALKSAADSLKSMDLDDQSLEDIRDQLAVVYETHAGECLRDPWGARDRWVECLLAPERSAGWLEAEASAALTAAAGARVRDLLALARHALLMQTSCGWFFDELTGLEPLLVLRHAARAIELARGVGAHLEDGFVTRLASARGNTGETGAALYRRLARGGEDA